MEETNIGNLLHGESYVSEISSARAGSRQAVEGGNHNYTQILGGKDMNKKRLVSAIAAIAITAGLLAGCASTPPATPPATPPTTPPPATEPEVKLGMSTDEGGLGDKSFNDAANAGLQKIESEFGIKSQVVQSKQADQYENNLDTLAKENDLIIGVGFKMEEAVKNVSTKYPDKKFLIIDAVVDNPNVQSVLFKEQEGSFLLGVIAGSMTKTNKVGFIGGMEGPVIGRFHSGFIAGVMSVNPEAGALLKEGTMVKYAGSFNDTSKGNELAKDLYNQGADIIYHAAGGVGLGLFEAAQEMGKFAMGVDSDQAALIPDKAGVILVSMMKMVDQATYTSAKSMIEGKFTTGTTTLGIKEGAVGLSPTLHPDLKANAELLTKVEDYSKKISDGTIVVPATLEELASFTPAQ